MGGLLSLICIAWEPIALLLGLIILVYTRAKKLSEPYPPLADTYPHYREVVIDALYGGAIGAVLGSTLSYLFVLVHSALQPSFSVPYNILTIALSSAFRGFFPWSPIGGLSAYFFSKRLEVWSGRYITMFGGLLVSVVVSLTLAISDLF